jgi:putative acetyltransferase
MITIRPETETDHEAVHRVNRLAFGQAAEADLVDAVRSSGNATISLVATDEAENAVGHILFSPISVPPTAAHLRALGLAPMAVVPDHQNRGIGTLLVKAGLDRAKELGYQFVVVLGHPHYYPRFGFRPSAGYGMQCAYDAPPEAFMVVELEPGCLHGFAGTVRYLPQFDGA